MFIIKAFAQPGRISVNAQTGAITRGRNPQSRFYERTGQSQMGGNARTRGRPARITRAR